MLEHKKAISLETARSFFGLLTLFGFALAFFIAIASLSWPLGPDQGIYAWVGSVILEGGVPYKDAWDVKGPLCYYTYAFATALLGNREYSIRVIDLSAVVACCILLRRLTLRLNGGDTLGGNCAVIFFVLAYYGWWGPYEAAEPDGWGGMFILYAVYLLLYPPTWNRYLVHSVVGFAIALATLLKPVLSIYLLLPVLCVFSGDITERAKKIRLLATSMCFFTLTVVLSILVLSHLGGGLEDYADLMRFLSSSHLPKNRSLKELMSMFDMLLEFGLLTPYLVAPLGIYLLRLSGRRLHAQIFAVWFGLSLLLVVAQGRYFPYHFVPATIAAAPSIGIAITSLNLRYTRVRFSTASVYALLAWLIAITPLSVKAVYWNYQWPAYIAGFEGRDQYIKHITPGWDYGAIKWLSTYLAQHSLPTDRVLMWGWDPLLNVLAERDSPSRFGFSYPLVISGPLQSQYRRTFLREISRVPPKFIVIDDKDPWDLFDRSGMQFLHDFPEFDSFIQSRYRISVKVSYFQLWTLIQ